MNRLAIVFAAGLAVAAPAFASDESDIISVLNQWNDPDEAKALAACADDASVIDDIPPFEWHGPGACSRWLKDYDAYLEKQGMTDVTGTVGKPRQLIITGDRAYAVVPTTFAYTKKGKSAKVSATTTFSLQRTAAGWRITGWAWATLTLG